MNIDDIKGQIVNSVSAQAQPEIDSFFDGLNAQVQLFVTIGIVLSVLWALVMIAGLIIKWRSHAAIMRIDKNVQNLVASQLPPSRSEYDQTK